LTHTNEKIHSKFNFHVVPWKGSNPLGETQRILWKKIWSDFIHHYWLISWAKIQYEIKIHIINEICLTSFRAEIQGFELKMFILSRKFLCLPLSTFSDFKKILLLHIFIQRNSVCFPSKGFSLQKFPPDNLSLNLNVTFCHRDVLWFCCCCQKTIKIRTFSTYCS